jgi:hypothetical protein
VGSVLRTGALVIVGQHGVCLMLCLMARTGHTKGTVRVTYLLCGGYDIGESVMICGIVLYSWCIVY